MNRLAFLFSIRVTCGVTHKSRTFKVEAEDSVQAEYECTRDAHRWAERVGAKRNALVFEAVGKRHA